ncbi:thiol reductant ABC exporter subunit CydD [Alteromonas mediterranea]|uniref:thiol reductant ABC exporter subunit CydD n=1 Tax=Alteromonas mediterranea TaxID=314275 RepID=UPI0009034A2F|nr:thiol reductant ABC exporter subunit CydD [Alteromonas mediterranea]APD92587.1 thiol reductant ABC exporter subunit CydD [Alteromonas mediterranea]APD96202.1 thiol reductant ABC exporter subunit CydD [Alteromonas mediterranea]
MANDTLKAPNTDIVSGAQFLKKQVVSQRARLRQSVLYGTFASVLIIAQWLLVALIAQDVLVNKVPIHALATYWLLLIAVSVVKPMLTWKQTSLAQGASSNIRSNLRNILLERWNSTSPIALQSVSTGALASQWIEDIEATDGYFSRYWPQQMLAVITPLLILVTVAYLNWLCAVLLLVSAPLIPLFMILVGMGAEHVNEKYALLRQRLAGHFLDRVANLSTIALLGAQKSMSDEVANRGDTYRKVVMKTLKLAFLSSTVLEFFTSVAIASLAIYIGFSLYGAINWGPAQSLTLFSGLGILLLAPEFFKPLRNLSTYYHDKASAVGAANNIVSSLQHLEEQEAVLGDSDARQVTASNDVTRLMLKDAVIGYNGNKQKKPAFNFSFSGRGLLVFSGESGCGKTTLLNTIAGYLHPVSGRVEVALKEANSIAYLPQKAWIKNTTVRDNLSVTADFASDEEMLRVLEKLELSDELLTHHNGLDTVIGEHGQGLSGGQMQRIALARVLLNPPELILLDEPTASLDIKSRLVIIEALDELKSRAFVVVATHDSELIAKASNHFDLTNKA